MPRIEAGEIFGMIKQRGQSRVTYSSRQNFTHRHLALDIDPNLSIEIMGSYRRCVCS